MESEEKGIYTDQGEGRECEVLCMIASTRVELHSLSKQHSKCQDGTAQLEPNPHPHNHTISTRPSHKSIAIPFTLVGGVREVALNGFVRYGFCATAVPSHHLTHISQFPIVWFRVDFVRLTNNWDFVHK